MIISAAASAGKGSVALHGMAIGEGTKIDNLVQVGHNHPAIPGRELGMSARALPMARSTAADEGTCMNEASTTLEAADIATILKALPHRYPFLMIDRIINMRGDESAIGSRM